MVDQRYPKPADLPVRRRRSAEIAARVTRVLCALVPLALGFVVFWQQSRVRVGEAVVAQAWLGWVMDGPVTQVRDLVTFPWVGGPIIGMQISEQCTVAYLLGPMCLLAALLTILTKSSLPRLAGGLLVGSGLLIIVNQLRVAIIAASTQEWGIPGYDVTHKLVGTLVALVGFTVAALVMVMVATGRQRFGGHRGQRTA